jgi:hypothetical protein
MAPELWEGKVADARSDIYSFGCVLYELVTGKRVGKGPLAVEPPALDRVVKTCLAADPDARFQRAADVRRELEWALDKPRRKVGGAWAGVLVAAMVIILGAFLWPIDAAALRIATACPHGRGSGLERHAGIDYRRRSNPLA